MQRGREGGGKVAGSSLCDVRTCETLHCCNMTTSSAARLSSAAAVDASMESTPAPASASISASLSGSSSRRHCLSCRGAADIFLARSV
jgi:hypothetical protein